MNKIQQNIKKYIPLFGEQWSKFNNYDIYKFSFLSTSSKVKYDLALEVEFISNNHLKFNTKNAPATAQIIKKVLNSKLDSIKSIQSGNISGIGCLEIELEFESSIIIFY